ncbi:putative polymerase with PALM domain, HD hydrolase domain and Zn ribbon [Halobacteroides halobius DSM 5150]|uniref:Putative polymerase with PALM domain, HD hydrolase domain and Zn ribbon n=1 Tax=Halobacteroides halobius (strain ATCC 35273 / DSM 5150 / MD-1) TaxID=748449 RepID=L0K8F7_HALHC|nr:FapA family protein [Halobacteroides halobius]AGB40654.1 putative polymerase with PALM domain, HD hydrolase domain and Zn ribbon [Halobacteroides halobius DSM 5150]
MINQKVRVEGDTKEEALTKAYQLIQQQVDKEFDKSNISLNLVKEEKRLWGLMGTKKVYQAVLKLREETDIDGDFNILIKEEGIFLEVIQPQGDGAGVSLAAIEEQITEKEIIEVDQEAVSEALTLGQEKIKIAERKPELDRDAEINLEISDDQLKAYLDYIPALGGKKLTADEIIDQVKERGVIFGLREEEFRAKFNQDKELESFLIAQGEEPTPGEDGQLDFKFDLDRQEQKVNLKEDGTADFYNLNRIVNVESGDLLVEKIPPVEGKAGTSVKGQEMPPKPVEEAEIPVGENVSLSDDGLFLEAEMEGQVVYTNQVVSVTKIHKVNGNVNLETGNIDFNGSVIINGNIEDGMEVKATGNIHVKGCVYNAQVESGGQITINKGFIAGDKGYLKAEGDIEVKFVENGIVETKGSLIVKQAIMHSQANARKKVIVEEGKGLIVGGEIRAGIEISAKEIGSNLATPTEIGVGVTPQLRDEYNKVKSKLETKKEKLEETIKNINLLNKQEAKGRLEGKKEQLLQQLTNQRNILSRKVKRLKTEQKELTNRLEEDVNARVKVKKTIYSGVNIMIGNQYKKIKKKNTHVQYYAGDEEIKSASY